MKSASVFRNYALILFFTEQFLSLTAFSQLECSRLFTTSEWGRKYDRSKVLMNYKESRDLSDVFEQMGASFVNELMEVSRHNGHIIDAGAGMGVFAYQVALPSNPNSYNNYTLVSKVNKQVAQMRSVPMEQRAKVTAITAKLARYINGGWSIIKSGNLGVQDHIEFFTGRLFEEIPNGEIIQQLLSK